MIKFFPKISIIKRNVFKPKRGALVFGIWNTIEERVLYECIHLLMTKIVSNSSGTFSLIKSNIKRSLGNEKVSLTFNNLNSEKKRTSILSEF